MTQESSAILYHYCSLDTFLCILRNKTFRLSDITKSNDRMERNFALYKSKDIIFEFIRANGLDEKRDETELKQLIQGYLKDAIDFVDETARVNHALCFSTEGDLLSQWRAYGNDGKGVAIGFDRSVLEKIFSGKNYIGLDEIHYGELVEQDKQSIKRILELVKPHIENAPLVGKINTMCQEVVIRWSLNQALLYKHPGFQEENEVRLHTSIPLKKFGIIIHPDFYLNKLKEELAPLEVNYDYIARESQLSSYIDIGFIGGDIPTHQFIKKIFIGPRANISESEMKEIMRHYGIGVDEHCIEKSSTPYC